MKVKKSSLFQKYKLSFKVQNIIKRINKRQDSLQKQKLKLKKRVNKLIGFTLLNQNAKIIRKVNQEKNLLKNLDLCIHLEENVKLLKDDAVFKKDYLVYTNVLSLIKVSPTIFNLKKEICLLKWNYHKQFFFTIKEIIESLEKSNSLLLWENLPILRGKSYYLFSLEEKTARVFQNMLCQVFFKEKHSYTFNSTKMFLNTFFFKELQKSILNTAFLALTYNIGGIKQKANVKKVINLSIEGLNSQSLFWEATGLPNLIVARDSALTSFQNTLLKQKKVSIINRRRTSSLLKQNLVGSFGNTKSSESGLKNYIWKRNNYFFVKGTPLEVSKLAQLLNKKLKYTSRRTSLQLLYVLSRLEEKLEEISKNNNTKIKEISTKNLLILQGLLTYLLREKKERAVKNNMLLASAETVFNSQRKTWKDNLLNSIRTFLNKGGYKDNAKYKNFVQVIRKKLNRTNQKVQKRRNLAKNLYLTKDKKAILFALRGRRLQKQSKIAKKGKNSIKFQKTLSQKKSWKDFFNNRSIGNQLIKNFYPAKSWRKSKFAIRRNWVGVKPVLVGKYTTFVQKKQMLSTWAERPIDLFFINTLSLSKFAFKLERIESPQNKPNRFLSIIERDFINKYKYVAIYIKDLVRIGFISMFLKKPSFLAKFAAFQLAKLPRNRKETVFIRFLIKAIKTFAAGRKEILAVRVKIKGRVNRWRRTKYIVGTRGTLPLQNISERIEQGTAQAINRKGAVGIRIWVRYKPAFLFKLNNHILTYMRYSSLVKFKRRRKAIILK